MSSMKYKYVQHKTWDDQMDINSKYLRGYNVAEEAWISPSALGLECGLKTEEFLFRFPVGAKNLSFFCEMSKPDCGTHPVSYSKDTRNSFFRYEVVTACHSVNLTSCLSLLWRCFRIPPRTLWRRN